METVKRQKLCGVMHFIIFNLNHSFYLSLLNEISKANKTTWGAKSETCMFVEIKYIQENVLYLIWHLLIKFDFGMKIAAVVKAFWRKRKIYFLLFHYV